MSRRSHTLPAALGVLLALPAGAQAETVFQVDPTRTDPACSGTECGTLAAAVSAAKDGDTIAIKAGVLQEPPLTIDKRLVVVGAPENTVLRTANGTGSTMLSISAPNVAIIRLTVATPDQGARAMAISGPNATLDRVTLVNESQDGADVPTLDITASSGTTTIKDSTILNRPRRATAGTAPAIKGAESSSLVVQGTRIVSGGVSGDALQLPGIEAGTPNRVVGSSLLAIGPEADGIDVLSLTGSTATKQLQVDSTSIAAGQNGAGLRAYTPSGLPLSGSDAGDILATLRYVTIAGADKAIIAVADGAGPLLGGGPADVNVEASRSIIHGGVAATAGQALSLSPASSKVTITNSDTNATNGGNVALSDTTYTPDPQLFADGSGRFPGLRPDAPVIDKGGPTLPTDVDKDVDGDPRVIGPASDLGADEFTNKKPTAVIKASSLRVQQGQAVTFDASESSDPEVNAGGGLKEFRWEFGDGETQSTTTPTTTHTYAKVGPYDARVTVVDAQDNVSNPSSVTSLAVVDLKAPSVKVSSPRKNQTFTRFVTTRKRVNGRTRTTRTRRTITFKGTVSDANKVAGVQLSIRRRAGSDCRYVTKSRKVAKKSCARPTFFPVAVKEGAWAFKTRSTTNLPAGSWTVTVRGTDESGNIRSVVRNFRIK
ncbi:PKD domain-containing protein [Conexibacter sp. SYSU D00693]|uniref:PKD domain-containing protein n=1 Tax=Conexibacter sp. SYSU D00693 TaxID=2812560 RepID=UPI00196B1233|nr:PKD domain-containing protein [Conexibacter sp. SYSU D00693]